MKLYRPSDLHTYLETLGASPKKRLSQHFLIDGNILDKIVKTAEVQEGDSILEIGPGPGALTRALLEKGAHVVAIEKDPLFVKGLRFPQQRPSLEVVEGDVLKLPLPELLGERGKRWKVVANLPYHITTPILARLFCCYPTIATITIMVQKEVAERMTAHPGTGAYGRLSLFTHIFTSPRICFHVSPNSFYPKPGVVSSVMHLTLHQPPALSSEIEFFEMIKTAFGHKRKMIRTSLKELYETEWVEKSLQRLSSPVTTRPQDLSLEAFIQLFESLSFLKRQGEKEPNT